jgi:hypothetical protein
MLVSLLSIHLRVHDDGKVAFQRWPPLELAVDDKFPVDGIVIGLERVHHVIGDVESAQTFKRK